MVPFKRLEIWLVLGILLTVAIRYILLTQEWHPIRLSNAPSNLAHPLLALHAARQAQTADADNAVSQLVSTATPHPNSQPTIHSTSFEPTYKPTAAPSLNRILARAGDYHAISSPSPSHQSIRSPTQSLSITPGSEIRTSGVIVRRRSRIDEGKPTDGTPAAQIKIEDKIQTSAPDDLSAVVDVPSTSRRDARDQEGPSVYDIHGEGSVLYKVHPLRQRKHWKSKKRKSEKRSSQDELFGTNISSVTTSLLLRNETGNASEANEISGAPTREEREAALPAPQNNDSAGRGEVVLLSWPRASDHFGYLNYKALESWLHIWPAAQVRVLAFAPQYALNYKFADALSVMQFQKYQKRGYDVSVELLHANSNPKLWPPSESTSFVGGHSRHNTSEKQHQRYPGQKYFNAWCVKGLFGQGMPFRAFKGVRRAIPRFELWAFTLLARAWTTGGVISDFTTFATQAPTGRRGLDLCPDPKPPQSSIVEPLILSSQTPALKISNGSSNIFSWLSSALTQSVPQEDTSINNPGSAASHSGPVSVKHSTISSDSTGPFSSLAPPPPSDPAAAAAEMAASGCDGGMAARFGPFDPALRCLLESYDAALDMLCDRDCLRHRASLCADAEQSASISSDHHSNDRGSNKSSRSSSIRGNTSGGSTYSATGALAVAEARRAAKAAKVAARAVDKARAKAEKSKASTTNSTNNSTDSTDSTNSKIINNANSTSSSRGTSESNVLTLAAALPSPNTAAAAVSALHWPHEPFTLHLVNWRNCDRALPSPDSELNKNASAASANPAATSPAASLRANAAAVNTDTNNLHAPLLWLGPDSTSGQWRSPRESGPDVARAVKSLHLNRWPPLLQRPPEAGIDEEKTTGSNSSLMRSSTNSACSAEVLAKQFHACTVFSASSRDYDEDDHGGDARDGNTATSTSRSTVTSSSPSSASSMSSSTSTSPLQQVEGVRRMRCTPSFFLAGASKSASTWLFNLLALHPQVLRPLEGAGFKEAGAYALKNGRHAGVGSNLASKLHRFPFIEAMELPDGMTSTFQQQQPHSIDKEMDNGVGKVEGKISFEPFVSADGSVGYMFESAGIPQQIWADTRGNAKVIFVVREPVERTWSDYRYLAHNYVPHRISFNKIALPAATALALDTCFGTHVLNGTLDEALAAEEESAAVARASQGKSVELPPAALRFATTFAHNRFANASMQYTQQQQQSLSLEEQRHENRQRRLFPTEAFYQSSCGRVAADPHQLVKKSLYVFMVLHWRAHLGPSNVLVVDAADFRGYASGDNGLGDEGEGGRDERNGEGGSVSSSNTYSRGARAFAQVVQFLGLCPWRAEAADVPSKANVGRRGTEDVPRKLRLDVRGQRFLGEFFAPYDAALEQVVGRSFGWQETRAKKLARLEAEAQAAHLLAEEAKAS